MTVFELIGELFSCFGEAVIEINIDRRSKVIGIDVDNKTIAKKNSLCDLWDMLEDFGKREGIQSHSDSQWIFEDANENLLLIWER